MFKTFITITCLVSGFTAFSGEKMPSPQSIDCADGEKISFTLKPSDKEIRPDIFSLPDFTRIRVPSNDYNARLDICFTESEEVILKRLIYKGGYGMPEIYNSDKGDFKKLEGLEEAIFGDVGALEIDAYSDDDEYKSGLRIKGHITKNGSLVTVQNYGFKKIPKPNSSSVLVGILEVGNPFSDTSCFMNENKEVRAFELGSASFQISICTGQGIGETSDYRFIKMSVSDTSENLPKEKRGVTYTLEDQVIDDNLQFRVNHHNSCDSFHVTVPETKVQYAASTPPSAGCGSPIGSAPERSWDEEGEDYRKTFFVVDYGKGFGEIQRQDIGHYVFQGKLIK